MTERDQHIAALFHEGKGQRAIARALGISQPAVRKRLLRLRLITSTDDPPDVPGPGDNLTAASQSTRHTAHFRAACTIYPHFSFNVPVLRSLRQERGEEFPSGVVHFHRGLLDTRAQGFTEAEADAVRTHLETRRSRPEWGVDIIVASPLGR